MACGALLVRTYGYDAWDALALIAKTAKPVGLHGVGWPAVRVLGCGDQGQHFLKHDATSDHIFRLEQLNTRTKLRERDRCDLLVVEVERSYHWK